MESIRRAVIGALLVVWFFPAVGAAKPAPAEPVPLSAPVASTALATSTSSDPAATESLAAREKQAPQLQDFKGGRVYIYLGSGAILVIVIILLILLV